VDAVLPRGESPDTDTLVAAVVPLGDRSVTLLAGGNWCGTLAVPQLLLNYYARKLLVSHLDECSSPFFMCAFRVITHHDAARKRTSPELLGETAWFHQLDNGELAAIRAGFRAAD
jgi:hypothetical protein